MWRPSDLLAVRLTDDVGDRESNGFGRVVRSDCLILYEHDDVFDVDLMLLRQPLNDFRKAFVLLAHQTYDTLHSTFLAIYIRVIECMSHC